MTTLFRYYVVYTFLMAFGLTVLVGVIGWLLHWQSLADHAWALRFAAVLFWLFSVLTRPFGHFPQPDYGTTGGSNGLLGVQYFGRRVDPDGVGAHRWRDESRRMDDVLLSQWELLLFATGVAIWCVGISALFDQIARFCYFGPG